MKTQKFPILDDHIHIDPRNGKGIEAIKEFKRAGGTHICLVTKPSWSLGVHPTTGDDFRGVFDETLEIAREITEDTGVVTFVLLGVHPAEITVLSERMTPEEAADIMAGGLTLAAQYVQEGRAIGLKSGRPHYEVSEKILALSNQVLTHGFTLAADESCAIQVHAETGPCEDMITMAQKAGLNPCRVIKHFASPDTPLSASIIAKQEQIPELCRQKRTFTLESDYMDENSRPGAVIGPKSVPRFTNRYLEQGHITEEDVYRIHVESPKKFYGIDITI
ncbi:TatD family hydrolase [Methanospirillum stamsii]|uniref:Hydrolase TatD n=1 Tax=Methanospirillum stamsii TaxID=1277351 RepID=A0A2V2NEX5_9EURY|nr:TatD family hydrolase [Methanospirillum stamsii]PWR74958.1 hydrolase TatD [Methanospirillum stamsii]